MTNLIIRKSVRSLNRDEKKAFVVLRRDKGRIRWFSDLLTIITVDAGYRWLVGLLAILCLLNSTASAQQEGKVGINISPPSVTAGTSPTITITSSGGFDFSNVGVEQVSISPGNDIFNMNISAATPTNLTLSFDLAGCQAVNRTLTIRANNVSLSAPFGVVLPSRGINISRIKIEDPFQEFCKAVLNVTSCDLDLSQVTAEQVSISPGVADLRVSNPTPTRLTLSFGRSFSQQGVPQNLTVRFNGVSATTSFSVFVPQVSTLCAAGQVCCQLACNGRCLDCQSGPQCR